MKINLYNSLSKSIEELKPIDGNLVRMYSCGPTVYNYAHIGNMRAFLFPDLLQRILRVVGGYNVKWVMNITNIDDKTIRDSKKDSGAWLSQMGEQSDEPLDNLLKLTKFYELEFQEDLRKLGINTNHFFAMPKATDYIPEMLDLVRNIHKNGYAYISDGSVYFNVGKWAKDDTYGRLFHIDFDNFIAGARVDSDLYERESASDFVLWKATKEGEPFWDFSLDGVSLPGRPGWHLECSAMEYKILGLPFDIHTGGVDLKFPHHEDEIAQSKAGYCIDPTNVFCHNEFLEVEGTKMSKSLGNFFTLRDLIEKGIDPLDIRFAMLSAQYGSVFNFTFGGIEAGKKGKERIQDFIYCLYEGIFGDKTYDVASLKNEIFSELANNLHTPKALSKIFSFINVNSALDFNQKTQEELIQLFMSVNEIFAVWKFEKKVIEKIDVPQSAIDLADQRIAAKKAKDWALADSLRHQIFELGFVIMDTKDGYKIEAK